MNDNEWQVPRPNVSAQAMANVSNTFTERRAELVMLRDSCDDVMKLIWAAQLAELDQLRGLVLDNMAEES